MTMKTLRDQQRAERVAYVAKLLEEVGSVRQAAKVGELDPATIRRLRQAGAKTPILTPPTPARTN
jgi:ribosomal protein L29